MRGGRADASMEIPDMSELLSRILLSTEAIVISFPLTAYFLTEKLPVHWQQAFQGAGPAAWIPLSACLVLLTYVACIWRLIVAFSVDGGAALRRLFVPFWYVPHVVAAVAATALVLASAVFVIQPSWLSEFAWALPLAIPSAHLGLERLLRPDARAAIEPAVPLRIRPRAGVSLKSVR
jgi:hypothetical protein